MQPNLSPPFHKEQRAKEAYPLPETSLVLRNQGGFIRYYDFFKETIWAGALSDILTQNEVPFATKNTLGAGLSAKMGPALERTRFYVPYSHYQLAQDLEREFFSSDFNR